MLAVIPFPDISPEIVSFTLFGMTFALRWYAMAYLAGILLGWLLARRVLVRPALWAGDSPPMTREQLDDLITWIIVGIIAGGRLGFVLFYQPGYYLQNPAEIPMIWQGGMAFHGGLAGTIIAAAIYCRSQGIALLPTFDMMALCTPPGILLGRIANFINGELWGRPTDAPWGVVFPGPAAQDCPGVDGLCARHPSQLYEAGLEGLVLGLVLILLVRAGGFKRPGLVAGAFVAGYGIARFIVEYFRLADAQFITPGNPYGHVLRITDTIGFTMGQMLSLPMVAVGSALILFAYGRTRPARG